MKLEQDDVPIELEPHYSSKQIAKMWGVSTWTVIRMFRNTPGVLRHVVGTRQHIRVPSRVLRAYHEKLTGK